MTPKYWLSASLAACLLAMGAVVAGAAPRAPETRTVAAGPAFDLAVGEAVGVAGRPLRLGLHAVLADSRCPRGERCVHAGEMQLQLWVQQGSAPREVLDLVHRPGGVPAPVSWPGTGLVIRFLDVQPAPVSGRTIATGDYRVHLTLETLPAAAPQH